MIDDNKAYVSFEALFTQAGKDQSHREKAEFERERGKWRFVTGGRTEESDSKVRNTTPRPQRTMFLRLRQEVQKMLWRLAAKTPRKTD